MGRHRTYDSDKVLEAARDAFWTYGYEGTSVADLCRVTGLEKGSLYHAFGDKKQLFLTVLDRYLAYGLQLLEEAFDTDAPILETVRGWLKGTTTWWREGEMDRGCLAINSMVGMGPHHPEVAKRIELFFERSQAVLTIALERGQIAGQVRSDRPADELARFLFVVLHGLAADSRVGAGHTGPIDLAVDTLVG